MTVILGAKIGVRGELLEFLAIIYLENGIDPRAMLCARFCSNGSMLGYRTNSSIGTLKKLVHRVSREIATFYGYNMVVTQICDLMDTSCYVNQLREMQEMREFQESTRVVSPFI